MKLIVKKTLGDDDPKKKALAEANAKVKEFAVRRGLIIGNDAHVDSIPKYIDAKTGKDITGVTTNLPQSQITPYVPPYVKSLEWDAKANMPYFIDEKTGDQRYVPKDYFYLPRFNPNRGQNALTTPTLNTNGLITTR